MGNFWKRAASSTASESSEGASGHGTGRRHSGSANGSFSSGDADHVGLRELQRVLAETVDINNDRFLTDVVTPLMGTVKFSDIGLRPPARMDQVGCMTLVSGPRYSLCFFFIPPGKTLPLHDHPGMDVVQKVVFGKARVTGYDWVTSRPDPPLGQFPEPGLAHQVTHAIQGPKDPPSRLRPSGGGVLHSIAAAGDEVCGFLDFITPPYTGERDCTFFAASPPLDEVSIKDVPQSALDELQVPPGSVLAAPHTAHLLTPLKNYHGVPMVSFRAPDIPWLRV